MANKIKNNPEFDNDEASTEEESTEEEFVEGDEADQSKDSDDESENEEIESDAATDEEPNSDDAVDDAEKEKKLKALEALDREENKINNDVSEIDKLIEEKKRQIVEKRKARREKREEASTIPEIQEEEVDLSDIDPDELQRFDKIAKAKGFVPKSELQREQLQASLKDEQDGFFKDNPEYSPENDPNDLLYNALKAEVELYKAPSSSKGLKAILAKAHKAVKEQYPQRFPSGTKGASNAARQARKKISSTASGISGSPTRSKSNNGPKLDPNLRSQLKGFTEKELDEMF